MLTVGRLKRDNKASSLLIKERRLTKNDTSWSSSAQLIMSGKDSQPGGFNFNFDNIDLDKLSPVYGIGSQSSANGPEYIQSNPRGRDFYGRLSFNTGVLWLGGFSAGGVYGFAEGWRNAASPNYKIRFNSVMNSFSRRGTILGNNLGIVGE